MFHAFYDGASLLTLPILSMLLFMTTFATVTVVMWRRGANNPRHDHLARLPLDDDGEAHHE